MSILFHILRKPSIQVCVLSALIFSMWSHVMHTELGDPLGLAFDTFLWIASSILKIAALIVLPISLGAAYQSMSMKLSAALIALVIWSIVGIILLVLLSLTREIWAPLLSTDAVKYYSVSKFWSVDAEVESHYAKWLVDWKSGAVFRAEVALVALLASVHAGIGYKIGHRTILALIIGYSLTFVILGCYSSYINWNLFVYDFFHGDSFPSAVVLDHIFLPIATDPSTSISSLVYLVCFICNWAIVLFGNGVEQSSVARNE